MDHPVEHSLVTETLVHDRDEYEVADEVCSRKVDARRGVVEEGALAEERLLLQPQEHLRHVDLVEDLHQGQTHLLQGQVRQVRQLGELPLFASVHITGLSMWSITLQGDHSG